MQRLPTITSTGSKSTPTSRKAGGSSRSSRQSPRRRSSRNSSKPGRPMARTIRFHLDKCCDPAVADGLRRRGIDVTTSREVGLLEAKDEERAAYGLDENRVVFTRDADFLRLQATGVPHAGIIYRAKDTRGTSCHAIHKSWHACS